ncbi:MAG TPA: hypothetical protein VEA16_19165 [Vicinamibacterales bacterium]|nr:hypothetical protein [Vicinamibacterales bacterium]
MSPESFTFKLTVPNDPAGATVVAAVAAHAVEYANVDAPARQGFVDRVKAAALQALRAAEGKPCVAVFAAADGQLTVTLGGHSVSEPLPS